MTFVNADTNTLGLTVGGVSNALMLPANQVLTVDLPGGTVFQTPDGATWTNAASGVCSFTATTSKFVAGVDWQGLCVSGFEKGLQHGAILGATVLAFYGIRMAMKWVDDTDSTE